MPLTRPIELRNFATECAAAIPAICTSRHNDKRKRTVYTGALPLDGHDSFSL